MADERTVLGEIAYSASRASCGVVCVLSTTARLPSRSHFRRSDDIACDNALETFGENGCLRQLYAHFQDWSRLHFISLHFSFLGSVALDSDIVPI